VKAAGDVRGVDGEQQCVVVAKRVEADSPKSQFRVVVDGLLLSASGVRAACCVLSSDP